MVVVVQHQDAAPVGGVSRQQDASPGGTCVDGVSALGGDCHPLPRTTERQARQRMNALGVTVTEQGDCSLSPPDPSPAGGHTWTPPAPAQAGTPAPGPLWFHSCKNESSNLG